jgi:hypothetical protein
VSLLGSDEHARVKVEQITGLETDDRGRAVFWRGIMVIVRRIETSGRGAIIMAEHAAKPRAAFDLVGINGMSAFLWTFHTEGRVA